MEELISSANETKTKQRNQFPTISRFDLMEALLDTQIAYNERTKMSKLFSDILSLEKNDLKYISKITVSTSRDSEIYDVLRRRRLQKRGF